MKYNAWVYIGLFELNYLGVFESEDSAFDKIQEILNNMKLKEDEYQTYLSLSNISKIEDSTLNKVKSSIRFTILNDKDFQHSYNRENRSESLDKLANDISEYVVENLENFCLNKTYLDHCYKIVDGIILNYDSIMDEFEDSFY